MATADSGTFKDQQAEVSCVHQGSTVWGGMWKEGKKYTQVLATNYKIKKVTESFRTKWSCIKKWGTWYDHCAWGT